jgi:hypothetical protein
MGHFTVMAQTKKEALNIADIAQPVLKITSEEQTKG